MTIRRIEVVWPRDKGGYYIEESKPGHGDHILMSVNDAKLLATGDCNYPRVIQELRCVLEGYAPEQPE